MPEISAGEIARRAGGTLRGDERVLLRAVAPLDEAGPHDLAFLASSRYADDLHGTAAGAVLVKQDVAVGAPSGVTEIRVPDPHVALAWVLPLLYPAPTSSPGVHPTAEVAADVTLGTGVTIGPFATVGEGSHLADDVTVGAHAFIGDGCRIGASSVVHPHATLYSGVRVGERCIIHSGARLGSDGFGYVFTGGRHQKIPQVGGCVLGDDVEVGANTTIDRGSIGDTRIGDGTKIDNLVQIGHNTRVGRHVIIISQVGISGSTVIGDGVVIAGQAATSGHLEIGAGARIAGRAAVMGDIEAGATVSGYPARPHRESMRAQAAVLRLPELVKRVQRLEAAMAPQDASTAENGSPDPI